MTDSSADRERLIAECKRIQEFSLWNSATHFSAAAWARRFHLGLGVIPIVLGGIGGWKMLNDPQIASPTTLLVAGAMTVAAGIVGSVVAYWDLGKIRLEHFLAGAKYKTLENESRRAWEIHAHDEEYEAFKRRVMELAHRYDELGEASALNSDIAFWAAGRKIRKGTYDSDQATPKPPVAAS